MVFYFILRSLCAPGFNKDLTMSGYIRERQRQIEENRRMRELAEKQKGIRSCLRCEVKFESKSKFNRMCEKCRELTKNLAQ